MMFDLELTHFINEIHQRDKVTVSRLLLSLLDQFLDVGGRHGRLGISHTQFPYGLELLPA